MERYQLKQKTVRRMLGRDNKPIKWLTSTLGTNSAYMSQLLSGIRCPSPDMRKKIMKALGVNNFDELFSVKR